MILQKGKQDLLLDDNLVIITEKESDLGALAIFNDDELNFIKQSIDWKKTVIAVNQYKRFVFVVIPKDSKDINLVFSTFVVFGFVVLLLIVLLSSSSFLKLLFSSFYDLV